MVGALRAGVVAGGCALGVFARLADEVAPKWIGNVGAVWFMAGFLAGRLVTRPRLGARAGALCLLIATLAYYALRLALDSLAIDDLLSIPLWWLAVGTAIGSVSGWFGARSNRFVESWGAPAGVFLGEAVAVLALRGRIAQAAVEACCALPSLYLMKGAWGRGLLLGAATVPTVAVFAVYYRLVLWWH